MPSARVLRRVLVVVLVVVVTAVVAVGGLALSAVRAPFPQVSGTLALPGLKAPVEVTRDAHGVPRIVADTVEDLFRAQGYVHAQDRFFEMDWRRHLTAGRLSELVGAQEAALTADRAVRTMGWRRVAEAELGGLEATTRSYLTAYAAGVNAYLAGRGKADISVQYRILELAHPLEPIEPWTPVDSLAWFKAMAWDLRGAGNNEITRALAFGSLRDVNRVDQLFPAYPFDQHAPIVNGAAGADPAPSGAAGSGSAGGAGGSSGTGGSAGAGASSSVPSNAATSALPAASVLERTRQAVAAVPLASGGDGIGSNSLVVAGRLTADGKPLLANDPHLAPSLPGIWYQVGLRCRTVTPACPFDVSGFSFSGVPGVVIGHNARISWGLTNLGPDVLDYYLEKVDSRPGGDVVQRDGSWVPVTTRKETIRVAGGDPVTLTVRSTAHGPLISDVVSDVATAGRTAPLMPPGDERGPDQSQGYAVALRWTGLDPDRDMDAVFMIDTARDFPSFRTAAQRLDAPGQNLVYADVDGHIGYQATGRVPIRPAVSVPAREGRPSGSSAPSPDGRWPLPGWTGDHDWTGYLAPDKLPWTYDPAEGFVVAANQAPSAAAVGPIGHGFDAGYRSQRIRDLLQEATRRGKVTVADVEKIQNDTHHPMAAALLPALLKIDLKDPFYTEAVDLLRHWDGTQGPDSAAAAYFNAVWAALLDLTFNDELPTGARADGGASWMLLVTGLLARPNDPWWDDKRTPALVETRDEILREALVAGRDQLTKKLGKSPDEWSWGRVHRLSLVAVPAGQSGLTAPIHRLLNRGPIGLGGGTSVVDAVGWNAASGTFDVDWGPSMRMVVDLGDLDASRWVNQTGQSGHPGNGWYADQLGAWAEGTSYAWPFGADAVRRTAEETLTLTPR